MLLEKVCLQQASTADALNIWEIGGSRSCRGLSCLPCDEDMAGVERNPDETVSLTLFYISASEQIG